VWLRRGYSEVLEVTGNNSTRILVTKAVAPAEEEEEEEEEERVRADNSRVVPAPRELHRPREEETASRSSQRA
jgi:hypothetical protein